MPQLSAYDPCTGNAMQPTDAVSPSLSFPWPVTRSTQVLQLKLDNYGTFLRPRGMPVAPRGLEEVLVLFNAPYTSSPQEAVLASLQYMLPCKILVLEEDGLCCDKHTCCSRRVRFASRADAMKAKQALDELLVDRNKLPPEWNTLAGCETAYNDRRYDARGWPTFETGAALTVVAQLAHVPNRYRSVEVEEYSGRRSSTWGSEGTKLVEGRAEWGGGSGNVFGGNRMGT